MRAAKLLFCLCTVISLFAQASTGALNVIINGDFEDPGLTGVNSDYLHTPSGNVTEGTWWVSPWDSDQPWARPQHTPGGAGAMNLNGDNTAQAASRRVWYQSVPVTVGQQYDFTAWALATAAGTDGYTLEIRFDGVPVSGIFSPTQPFTWEALSASGVATSPNLNISIYDVSGITFPNDFMLDDISLTAVPEPCGAALVSAVVALAASMRRRHPTRLLARPRGDAHFD